MLGRCKNRPCFKGDIIDIPRRNDMAVKKSAKKAAKKPAKKVAKKPVKKAVKKPVKKAVKKPAVKAPAAAPVSHAAEKQSSKGFFENLLKKLGM
jgi:uncharacterized membrane-anchored protein YjiN (DUF445 family)